MTWHDLWAKSSEVQEAAAAAIEAENRRYREAAAFGAHHPRAGLSEHEATEAINMNLPYPYDPYDLAEIDQIPSYFSWLAYRDPVELDGKADALLDAHHKLVNAYTAHSDVESAFSEFNSLIIGDLSGYLTQLHKASDRQAELALELHAAIGNAQHYLGKANEDLADIADRAIDSLNDIASNGDGSSDKVMTALAGMTIGTIGAAATGAGAVGVIFAILSGAPAVLDSLDDAEKIGATTVETVLQNMFKAIDDRREKLASKEDDLLSALNKDDDLVTQHQNILEPNRPTAADRPADLNHQGDTFLVNVATLRYYAQEDMPRMASDFAAGNRAVARGANSGGAAALDQVYEVWQGLCTRLQGMSGRTSRDILDAADTVAAAATAFAQQDGYTADELTAAQRAVEQIDSEADEYTPGDAVEPVLPTTPQPHTSRFDRRTGDAV